MKRFGVGLLALVDSIRCICRQEFTDDQFSPNGAGRIGEGDLDRNGTDAKLTFAPNGKEPITVPAEIVNQKNSNIAVATINVNGIEYLQDVELSNMTLVSGVLRRPL